MRLSSRLLILDTVLVSIPESINGHPAILMGGGWPRFWGSCRIPRIEESVAGPI